MLVFGGGGEIDIWLGVAGDATEIGEEGATGGDQGGIGDEGRSSGSQASLASLANSGGTALMMSSSSASSSMVFGTEDGSCMFTFVSDRSECEQLKFQQKCPLVVMEGDSSFNTVC